MYKISPAFPPASTASAPAPVSASASAAFRTPSGPTRRQFLGLMLAGGGASMLSGCQPPPEAAPLPRLTFTHLPPYRFDVAVLDIINAHDPKTADPYVDYRFDLPPAAAAEQWVRDRIQTHGRTGSLVATILDGTVKEVPLGTDTGFTGLFKTEQQERYDARLAIRLVIQDAMGQEKGWVQANATRSRTVPEDISLAERQQIWFEITEALMQDINRELEKQIEEKLRPFLR